MCTATRFSVLLSLVFSASVFAAPLNIDTTHTRIGFTAKTVLFDVDGHFSKYTLDVVEGTLDKPETVKVVATIDTASVDTANEKRDDHLRSADFFSVKEHPEMRFTSTSVTKTKDGFDLAGVLEIRGKKKNITVPFLVVEGKNGSGTVTRAYRGKLTVNRKDFGIGAESVAAKISLKDDVDVDLLLVVFPGK